MNDSTVTKADLVEEVIRITELPRKESDDNNPDKMPFDFPEVLAAIAPRAVYVSAPLGDSNFEVSGVRKC
ncbi:MAG: hypothetical protein L0387_46040, partial [Acidobacteria bacterium]|nr:hypothetical protein [Acidobacteriota bacterium]